MGYAITLLSMLASLTLLWWGLRLLVIYLTCD